MPGHPSKWFAKGVEDAWPQRPKHQWLTSDDSHEAPGMKGSTWFWWEWFTDLVGGLINNDLKKLLFIMESFLKFSNLPTRPSSESENYKRCWFHCLPRDILKVRFTWQLFLSFCRERVSYLVKFLFWWSSLPVSWTTVSQSIMVVSMHSSVHWCHWCKLPPGPCLSGFEMILGAFKMALTWWPNNTSHHFWLASPSKVPIANLPWVPTPAIKSEVVIATPLRYENPLVPPSTTWAPHGHLHPDFAQSLLTSLVVAWQQQGTTTTAPTARRRTLHESSHIPNTIDWSNRPPPAPRKENSFPTSLVMWRIFFASI